MSDGDGAVRDHAVPAGNTDLAPTGDDPTGAGPEGQGLNPNIDKKRGKYQPWIHPPRLRHRILRQLSRVEGSLSVAHGGPWPKTQHS